MRVTLLFLGALLTASGCSHLILQDHDSASTQAAKVATRIPLGLVTLGLSEMAIHEVRMGQECQAQGATYVPAIAGTGGCRMTDTQYMEYSSRVTAERDMAREQSIKSLIAYCETTKVPQDCIAMFRAEKDLANHRDMQERQIAAQQAIAREQSRGMALFGSGPALINGMNQGFQNMRLPISPPPTFVPIQPNPVRSPITCYSSNPGPMQSTTCN